MAFEHIQPIVATTTFKSADKAKNASYNELAARMERADKLTEATEELQVQRNLMVCARIVGRHTDRLGEKHFFVGCTLYFALSACLEQKSRYVFMTSKRKCGFG